MAASILFNEKSHKDRVLEYLQANPDKTSQQIATALDLPRYATDKALRTMAQIPLVSKRPVHRKEHGLNGYGIVNIWRAL